MRRFETRVICTLAFVLAFLIGCSSGGGTKPIPTPQPIKLTWTPVVEAEDGSAVTDLTAYRIEYGAARKIVLPPTVTRYSLTLPTGVYNVRVVAVSATRGEAASNTLVLTR